MIVTKELKRVARVMRFVDFATDFLLWAVVEHPDLVVKFGEIRKKGTNEK